MAKSSLEKVAVRKRARRRAAEWRDEVAAWKASGQGAREYAAEHDLHPGTLLWWSSRGKIRRTPKKTVASVAGTGAAQSSFLPLRVRRGKAAVGSGGLQAEVVLAGGRRVRLLGDLSLEKLGRLLDVIEGGRSC